MKDKRIALVTGANQGIGFQVAKELAAVQEILHCTNTDARTTLPQGSLSKKR